MAENFKEAVLYEPLDDKKVRCNLCNWRCIIKDGDLGHCQVRKNIGGKLYSLNYHKLCSANPDPIEKKPLFHFQPGSRSFSIAAPGCNFQCAFCQNWQISQMALDEGQIDGQSITPARIVDFAIKAGCKSMAYTYTEPTVFMEFAAECGKIAKQKGLANVFVSNGFMTKEALDFAADWLDGINVDLKSFSEYYYKNLCKAKLKPVLETIEYIAKHTKIWMEITTLVVPGQNDSDEELKQIADFLVNTCGPDVPWHVSRFYPQYKYTETPPTPGTTLQRAYDIAKSAGLRYVYIGNLPSAKAENTYCPKCQHLLIEREGYYITKNEIKNSGCDNCGEKIAGFKLNG
ncbi:MAG: AmmeMemoRadiSam system radical SAM enzyme [Planctomycetes bacterium HGW-Planctomycetes-1]|nr:MAG: AmmeMemoRadiSam system radical SAM enzyme [Planctomycetes bacterium HGW-Planctomycetes-1]